MSCILGPLERFAEVLQACPSWSQFGGSINYNLISVDDEKESLSKTELIALRPFVILQPDYPAGYRMERDASSSGFKSSGTIDMVFEKNQKDLAPFDGNYELITKWQTLWGTLLVEIWDAAENRFDLRSIEVLSLARNSDSSTASEGLYVGGHIKIAWGQE